MHSEDLLHRVRDSVDPKVQKKSAIRARMLKKLQMDEALLDVRTALTPSKARKRTTWELILARIVPQTADNLLQKIGRAILPPQEARRYFQRRILGHLQPQHAPSVAAGRMKWMASFAIVALLVSSSPALFLTGTTLAESKVLLVPTAGEVAVYMHGMWYDVTKEMELVAGTRIRTSDGEASILYRDDAVVRMGPQSVLAIHDTSEHVEQAVEVVPTFSLLEGSLWVQGLLPSTVRGMTIAHSFGHLTVHQGSVSLEDTEDTVAVKVWDRRAILSHYDERIPLVAGEQTQLREHNVALIKKIPNEQFSYDWPKQNLAKDAVHRRYIAHLQHERLAALAGTLPTSPLYPVKRVAEHVDVMLTLNEQDKVQKQLHHANTRLNEAAALLADGENDQAVESLNDFRGAMLQVATGTGGDMMAQFLIKQSISEQIAEVSASLPGDSSYALKKAVLETTVSLPSDVINVADAEFTLFFDALDSLEGSAQVGDAVAIEGTWKDMQEYIALLNNDTALEAELKKEVESALARVAEAVESEEDLVLDDATEEEIMAFKPKDIPQVITITLTDKDIDSIVASMLDRIYNYKMPRSRSNQLQVEMTAIRDHDAEGQFLRSLYQALPDNSQMRDRVRKQIIRLRWQRAGEALVQTNQENGTEI